jgi:hypothetical protein
MDFENARKIIFMVICPDDPGQKADEMVNFYKKLAYLI